MDKNDFGILRGLITLLAEWAVRGVDPKVPINEKQKASVIVQIKRLHNESLYAIVLEALDTPYSDLQKLLVKELKNQVTIPGTE